MNLKLYLLEKLEDVKFYRGMFKFKNKIIINDQLIETYSKEKAFEYFLNNLYMALNQKYSKDFLKKYYDKNPTQYYIICLGKNKDQKDKEVKTVKYQKSEYLFDWLD